MFGSRERYQKLQTQRKQHIIRQWLTGLAVTSVVVVATLTMSPSPPTATIERIGSVGNRIYYTVVVKDSESALTPESLKLTVSNQLENYETFLKPGENSGVITDLSEDTEYDVRVVGSTGYGRSTLAQTEITTDLSPGGAILSTQLLPFDPNNLEQYYLSYEVMVAYQDPFDEYVSVTLKWTTVYASEYTNPLNLSELTYTSELMTTTDQTFTLSQIPNYNVYVILLLEAETLTGATTVLDTYIYRTPLNLEASLYVTDATDSMLFVSVYADFQVVEGIMYELELYEGDTLIETQSVVKIEAEPHDETSGNHFENLKPFTHYILRLMANYIDPQSGEQIRTEVATETAMTTPYYEVTTLVEHNGEFVQIDILVHDPSNFIHHFYYVIFDNTNGQRLYLSQAPIAMVLDLNGDKTASFEVMVPQGIFEFTISIQADKIVTPDITYYSRLVEIVTIE